MLTTGGHQKIQNQPLYKRSGHLFRCNILCDLPNQSNVSILGFEKWPNWAPLHYTRGKGLIHLSFSLTLDSLISKLKFSHKHYNTYSFQIETATSATQAWISDSQIKMLGFWQSDAHQYYVKTPPMELAKVSKQLVGNA